jgi:hypothetical protein
MANETQLAPLVFDSNTHEWVSTKDGPVTLAPNLSGNSSRVDLAVFFEVAETGSVGSDSKVAGQVMERLNAVREQFEAADKNPEMIVRDALSGLGYDPEQPSINTSFRRDLDNLGGGYVGSSDGYMSWGLADRPNVKFLAGEQLQSLATIDEGLIVNEGPVNRDVKMIVVLPANRNLLPEQAIQNLLKGEG